MLKKSLLDNSKQVTFKSVVRGNKVKLTDLIQQRGHSSCTNEQVEEPVQNYKNRQRTNQFSEQRTYGPETPLCHLPPLPKEMAELGVDLSSGQG